jgi:hypothetical protein
MPTGGKVLIAGGTAAGTFQATTGPMATGPLLTAALASVEEYDPGAGIFLVISGLAAPRDTRTSWLLAGVAINWRP